MTQDPELCLDPDLPDQIDWFRVLGSAAAASDLERLRVWHPFHHIRCTLTFYPVTEPQRREALIAAVRRVHRIKHPRLVPVLDLIEQQDRIGLLTSGDDGYTLRDCLQEVGALRVDEAAAIFEQLLSAVGALHRRRLVHGDLCPENILLAVVDGQLIARVRGFGRAPLGRWSPGSCYLAPEQISGGEASSHTDVFALGVLLYECLTGSLPFPAEDAWERRSQIRAGEQRSLAELVERLPMQLSFAVDSALRFDPGQRFASARHFAKAIPETAPLSADSEEVSGALDTMSLTPEEADPPAASAPERMEQWLRGAGPAGATVAPDGTSGAPPARSLAGRAAVGAVDALVRGAKLLRSLALPVVAVLLLLVLWAGDGCVDSWSMRSSLFSSRDSLAPVMASQGMALADEVIAVGVAPNQVRPLVARFEDARGRDEQISAGYSLTMGLLRHLRSLPPTDDPVLQQRRQQAQLGLSRLSQQYNSYDRARSEFERSTDDSIVGFFFSLLR